MSRSMYHPELVEGWFDGLTMIVITHPKGPEVFLVLLTSHFSLLTGLENAAGGFFQQTLLAFSLWWIYHGSGGGCGPGGRSLISG